MGYPPDPIIIDDPKPFPPSSYPEEGGRVTESGKAPESPVVDVVGWYGPPLSRQFHYFGKDGRSLCGKWFAPRSWWSVLDDPLLGECASCKKKLEAASV